MRGAALAALPHAFSRQASASSSADDTPARDEQRASRRAPTSRSLHVGSSNLSRARSSPRSCSLRRPVVVGLRGVAGATTRPLQAWPHRRVGVEDWLPRLRTGSPTCVRASQCRPGRERVPWMSSRSARPLRHSPACPTASSDTTLVDCHLGCAGSADRGVPTRTRHHNDGNRGRFDSRRRETPVSMRDRARPIGPRRLFSGAQAQIRPRSSADFKRTPSHPQNGQSTTHAGFRHGETRTRTGDTTIFSRYLLAARRREIPGNARFLRLGLAPLIFVICGGFLAFHGIAGLPSPFWPRGLLRR